MNLMMYKNKYEIAEMMGGILDEDDYFVNEYRQTVDMYKKYVERKYKYTTLSKSIINEIEKNILRLSEYEKKIKIVSPIPPLPPKLKRQCGDYETFERCHGISFDENISLFNKNKL